MTSREIVKRAVHLQQPRALGIEEMGRRYRGRIAFESLADIQATLPTGDRARVDADVADLEKHWMSPEGGFVLSDYGDGAAIGVAADTKKVMVDAFLSRDPYIAASREHPALAVINSCTQEHKAAWLPTREEE